MARIEVVRYKCDVCLAEFDDEKAIAKTTIPCYGGECNEYHSECTIDLCERCSKRLRELIYHNFAEISNYYGVHIRNKERRA